MIASIFSWMLVCVWWGGEEDGAGTGGSQAGEGPLDRQGGPLLATPLARSATLPPYARARTKSRTTVEL